MIDIDALEALYAETGSDGWKHVPDVDEYGNHTNERIIVGPDLDGATLADAECICAAHNLMPEIIAELRAARTALANAATESSRREQDISDLKYMLASCREQRDAAQARIDGADEAWRQPGTPWCEGFKDSDYTLRVRLVPDPLPGDAPATTSDGQVIGAYRITTNPEVKP